MAKKARVAAKIPTTVDVSLLEIAETKTTSYGKMTILGRALPDFRDGLKPVQRRIVWGMHQKPNKSTGGYQKSANAVGEVMGKFHPHGDCLDGDTQFYALDGSTPTIRSLTEKGVPYLDVLALDESGEYVPARAHSFRIGQNARTTYQVKMSDGSSLKVTGNHPFYVQGKGWVKATDLVKGDFLEGASLQNDSYPVFKGFGRKSIHLHRLVADHISGSGEIVHHRDEDTRNNTPENLEWMTRAAHASHHEHYLAGLENARNRMFRQEGELRTAIREKNSILMRTFNQTLPIRKSVDIVRAIMADGKKVTRARYETYRGRIYNGTTLETLEKKYDINFEGLISMAASGEFKMDTSAATGLTTRVKMETSSASNGSNEEAIKSRQKRRILEIVKSILATGEKLTFKTYASARKSMLRAKGGGNGRIFARNYPKAKALRDHYGSIKEMLRDVGTHGVFISRVKKLTHDVRVSMYDFTVDGHENALVVSSRDNRTIRLVAVHNSAIYGAMVTMANLPTRLVDGEGNWGSFNTPPADMRYTEARLARFADRILLDPYYLPVTQMAPNYDGRDVEPLLLPSLLPTLLLNGAYGIATGTTTNIPPFAIEGVIKLVQIALSGKDVSAKDCVKHLKFNYADGGVCTSSEKDLLEYFKTGKGRITFKCASVSDPERKTFTLTSLSPAFSWNSFYDNVNDWDTVAAVNDASTDEIKLEVQLKRSLTREQVKQEFDHLEAELVGGVSYVTNVTERNGTEVEDIAFHEADIPTIINQWMSWRIALEKAALINRREELEALIAHELLIIRVIDNVTAVIKAIRANHKDNAAQNAAVRKVLKCSNEEAETVLRIPLRSIGRLNQTAVEKRIKEYRTELSEVKGFIKKPQDRIKRWIDVLQKDLDKITG